MIAARATPIVNWWLLQFANPIAHKSEAPLAVYLPPRTSPSPFSSNAPRLLEQTVNRLEIAV